MSSSAVVAEMAQNGPKWSKIPYNASKWPKMPQPGPTLANKAQNGNVGPFGVILGHFG